ncbi:glycosyltransferase family 2 protein [Erythrobacter sp.]|uniref:glycosyltransferase family 2 protein n=1 Tax=Erythrobacter sp. TaxID=1042 RepID=UPI0025FC7068|nr:glycosyltransferase family 2 protein [Erythrobacter sp.]
MSIILPTFNRAHLIGESIASALGQSHPPAEIIVVDDGSTDRTADVVSNFGDPVRYLRQDNAGKSAALNRGIAAASGDALLVLDDDDLLPPGALAAHVAALVAAPEAGFSFGRFVRFSGPSENAFSSTDIEPLPQLGEKRLLVQLMQCCFLPNPAWMVRRDLQVAAAPYRRNLPRGQDYDMILRIARAAPGVYAGGITLHQRKHVAARNTSKGKVVAKDTVSGWIEAEQMMFRELDATWSDADFQPFSDSPAGPEGERLAILQRAIIMFMRKVHDRAAYHLVRYAERLGNGAPTPRELMIAGDLLGARYGIDDLIDGSHDPEQLGARHLPLSLRKAMARQMPWRMRELLRDGRFEDAAHLLEWGARAFGTAALLAAGADRLIAYRSTPQATPRKTAA